MEGTAMIVVTARIWGKAEKREDFLAVIGPLVKASNEEAGCISYRFYEDPLVPNDFIFVEEWESQESLDLHNKEPHFEAFARALPELVTRDPDVKVFEVTLAR
jgi:quinol monooxygenase YgiN